jgi:hypothetical protein
MTSGRNRQSRGVCRCRHRSCYWIVVAALCLCSTFWTALGGSGFNDPYKILGVSRRASSVEIKKVYRKLCLQYHPDKNVQKPARQRTISETKFKQVREAYDSILIKKYVGGTLEYGFDKDAFVLSLQKVWFFVSQPGLFLTELRRVNLFAMGNPFATRGPRSPGDPDVWSVYVQTVKVPLEDLYKGVPSFRLRLEDTLFARYRASIRGNFFLYSLHQASTFVFPLLRKSKVLAALVGFYIIHGTTPIPDPKASYTTRIRRGTRGGETIVRFAEWRQLELLFRIEEANHPIYRRVGNDLHVELTLASNEAKNGCRKQLKALDLTENAIEITIPAEEYSYEKEQELHRLRKQTQKRIWRQKRNRQQQGKTVYSLCPYDNRIKIRGRGWPIRSTKSNGNHPDAYLHGDLIVTIKVEKPSPKKKR